MIIEISCPKLFKADLEALQRSLEELKGESDIDNRNVPNLTGDLTLLVGISVATAGAAKTLAILVSAFLSRNDKKRAKLGSIDLAGYSAEEVERIFEISTRKK